jgi:hypothetical protein
MFPLVQELPLSELTMGLHLAAPGMSLDELGKALRESHGCLGKLVSGVRSDRAPSKFTEKLLKVSSGLKQIFDLTQLQRCS